MKSDPVRRDVDPFGPERRGENWENARFDNRLHRAQIPEIPMGSATEAPHVHAARWSPSSKSQTGWNVQRKVNAFSLLKKGAIKSAPVAFAIQAVAAAEAHV